MFRSTQQQQGPLYADVGGYQSAARNEKPLLRFIGRRDSALLNPGTLNRHWTLTREYFGTGDTTFIAGVTLGVFALAVAVAVFLWMNAGSGVVAEDYTEAGVYPWLDALIGSGVVALMGASFGATFVMFRRWQNTYTTVTVFEHCDPARVWRTTNLLTFPIPRLAFADASKAAYYTGASGKSGPREGHVELDLPPGERIVDGDWPTRCYELAPAMNGFTGRHSRETYDLLATAAEHGEKRRQLARNRGWGRVLEDNWVYFVMAAECVILFLLVAK